MYSQSQMVTPTNPYGAVAPEDMQKAMYAVGALIFVMIFLKMMRDK